MPVIDFIFDTETTGVINPDVLQLGLQVYADRYPIFEYAPLVKTVRKSIDPKALAVHGITQHMRETYGRPVGEVFKYFTFWLERADRVVAHNLEFDARVMELLANNYLQVSDIFAGKKLYDTMKPNTNVCKIPSPKRGGYKWPSLQEAYKHFVDPNGFVGAHNALVDVNACAKIFWAMDDQGLVKGAA